MKNNKMSRREERTALLEILFSSGYTPEKGADVLEAEWVERNGGNSDGFVSEVLHGIVEHRSEIDELITLSSVGWSIGRISRVSMAILREAVYEMLYCPDIPLRVTLNEAIELSKLYDDEKAYSFINGVLNKAMESENVRNVAHA